MENNTPRPTYCVFPVHVMEWWRIPQGLHTVFSLFMLWSDEEYPRAYILCFPCSCCGVMKNTPTYHIFPVQALFVLSGAGRGWQGGGPGVESRGLPQGLHCLPWLAGQHQAPPATTLRLLWRQALPAGQAAATQGQFRTIAVQTDAH